MKINEHYMLKEVAGEFMLVYQDENNVDFSKVITLNELGNLMKNLGCKEAMNFDGGSSSALYVNKKIVNSLGANFSFNKNGKTKKAFKDAIKKTNWNSKKYTKKLFESIGSSIYSLF